MYAPKDKVMVSVSEAPVPALEPKSCNTDVSVRDYRSVAGTPHAPGGTPSPAAFTSHGDAPPSDMAGQDPQPGSCIISEALEKGEGTSLPHSLTQSKPPEFPNLVSEIITVLVCSVGQLYYTILLGNIEVNQLLLVELLDIPESLQPWLIGSFLLANGLSVSVFGSITDIVPPKRLMVGAFAWMIVWNIVGFFSVTPERWTLFFVVRAMQGLATGVLVSASISILGRLYKPGLRKTRVFSLMASFSPLGFAVGGMQGAAFGRDLRWIFGSTAIVSAIYGIAAAIALPSVRPAKDPATSQPPSLRHFDYLGATFAVLGNTCMLFGITQGAATQWSLYTSVLTILGAVFLMVFCFVERLATRPLIPPQLWSTPGFTPLAISFFLAYGSWMGAWQPYAIQFFLYIQKVSPLTAAIYFIPNLVVGIAAMWIVAFTLHRYSNHWIFAFSMLANSLAPAFFLPQTANTTYWALSFPGIALGTFGPDMAFAASSIFITSAVPKSYQGSAGSLVIMAQNLGSALFVALAGTISVNVGGEGDKGKSAVSLEGLRAAWWFALAVSIVAGIITVTMVRVPKAEERDHVEKDTVECW
ncbi:MAG: hypothetical protein M1831_001393 [Alyxoria varia]|nr:MAG: hypothetical protein M1831_001393 [Alyxoria varia]